MQTIIDEKSVCSDPSRLIADVSAKHLMDTINQRDIVLVRLLCNNISQSKRYIVAAKFVVMIYVVANFTSTIYRNEAIVYDEFVFVYM